MAAADVARSEVNIAGDKFEGKKEGSSTATSTKS
jgi:hypothetical protein